MHCNLASLLSARLSRAARVHSIVLRGLPWSLRCSVAVVSCPFPPASFAPPLLRSACSLVAHPRIVFVSQRTSCRTGSASSRARSSAPPSASTPRPAARISSEFSALRRLSSSVHMVPCCSLVLRSCQPPFRPRSPSSPLPVRLFRCLLTAVYVLPLRLTVSRRLCVLCCPRRGGAAGGDDSVIDGDMIFRLKDRIEVRLVSLAFWLVAAVAAFTGFLTVVALRCGRAAFILAHQQRLASRPRLRCFVSFNADCQDPGAHLRARAGAGQRSRQGPHRGAAAMSMDRSFVFCSVSVSVLSLGPEPE